MHSNPGQVDNVSSPPRTACSGTLLAYTSPTVTGELLHAACALSVQRWKLCSKSRVICSSGFLQLCHGEKLRSSAVHHLVLEIQKLNVKAAALFNHRNIKIMSNESKSLFFKRVYFINGIINIYFFLSYEIHKCFTFLFEVSKRKK